MGIKVESAKDSGRSFGEPKVTVYEAVVIENGETKIVDCFAERVLDFIGKEIPDGTTITPNKNPQYHPKLNIPKDGQGEGYKSFFGVKKPFIPSFKDSKEAVVLSAKTMVLSYCKDLAMVGRNDPSKVDFEQMIANVKTGFAKIIP